MSILDVLVAEWLIANANPIWNEILEATPDYDLALKAVGNVLDDLRESHEDSLGKLVLTQAVAKGVTAHLLFRGEVTRTLGN